MSDAQQGPRAATWHVGSPMHFMGEAARLLPSHRAPRGRAALPQPHRRTSDASRKTRVARGGMPMISRHAWGESGA